jgi:hypothetical protein
VSGDRDGEGISADKADLMLLGGEPLRRTWCLDCGGKKKFPAVGCANL